VDGRQGVGEVPPLKLLFGDMVPVIPPAQPLCAPSLLKERERGPGEVCLATQGTIGRDTLPEVVQVLRSPALWKVKEDVDRVSGIVQLFFSLKRSDDLPSAEEPCSCRTVAGR
jgi:hypothetical protein